MNRSTRVKPTVPFYELFSVHFRAQEEHAAHPADIYRAARLQPRVDFKALGLKQWFLNFWGHRELWNL